MAYPTTLDSFTTKVDATDYPQAAHINDIQTAVSALEAKVGIDNSAVPTSIDYIIKNNIWPIGAVFTSVVSTNPNTLLGFGTWSQIAQGRTLIGQSGSDADFDTAEETGGSKTSTALIAHIHTVNPPSTTSAGRSAPHTHAGTTSGQSATHTHDIYNLWRYVAGSTLTGGGAQTATAGTSTTQNASGDHTHTVTTGTESADHTHIVDIAQFDSGSTGSGSSFSIMNPYFVVYFWKRTA